MSRQISRDPFARTTLFSETTDQVGDGCAWCGNSLTTKAGNRFLYRYYYEDDNSRRNDIPGKFDGISCMRAYHGG